MPLGSIKLGNMHVVALNVKRRINRNYANMQFMQNTIHSKKCKFRHNLNNRVYKYVVGHNTVSTFKVVI